MPIYECCCRDPMGHVERRVEITASDDAEARDIVARMFASGSNHIIELGRDGKLNLTARRSDGRSRADEDLCRGGLS
jgi:hypothetical protein